MVMEKVAEVLAGMGEDIAVDWGTNIKGKVTWKNIGLQAGSSHWVFFFLTKGGSYYQTVNQGVTYILGSMAETTAPAANATKTSEIPSRAVFAGAWDVLVTVGQVTGTIRALLSGDRIVGLQVDDLNAYWYPNVYDSMEFSNVLTVSEPPAGPGAEVVGFDFLIG
jgi:hypothetical protein